MSRSIASIRCGALRECANNQCILKMIFMGYKLNPAHESDKITNRSLERTFGKGVYPEMTSVGKGEFIDIVCNEYVEKR